MTTLSQHTYHQHLTNLLPPTNTHTPAQRLHAIAATAFNDSKFTRNLTPDQREEAFSHTLLIAAQAILDYNPNRDQGTGTIPQDRRVGRFVYLRCQQRIHDWLRTNLGDTRPGRTGRIETVSLNDSDENDHATDTTDDMHAAAQKLAGGLTEASALTLRVIATAIAEHGDIVSATEHLIRNLADELGTTIPNDLRTAIQTTPVPDQFLAWVKEAA